jgi:hypothetical protein
VLTLLLALLCLTRLGNASEFDREIKSLKRRYVPKTYLLNNIKIGRGGYYQVSLTKNNKQNTYYLHRLLAEAFLPNPENKPQVNHIDGNKLNNSISNLEWVSIKENAIHAHKNKLQVVLAGNKNHIFKYNIKVYDLKNNYICTLVGQKNIVKNGFDPANVYNCLKGLRQTHKSCTFKKEFI